MARSQRKGGTDGPRSPEPEPVRNPEPSPTERVYAVAFGRVWVAALGAVAAMRHWTVTAADPHSGVIAVDVRGVLRRTTRPARIRLALDALGLTRVDASFLSESGGHLETAEPRQIARFHRHLEALLRRDSPR
jgi:hypothetical protein